MYLTAFVKVQTYLSNQGLQGLDIGMVFRISIACEEQK
jgi:hypothetical protein